MQNGVVVPNIFEPKWDQAREHPGFSRDRAFVGRQAGAERLGASVWKLLPGETAYPYHFHYGDEELLIVLSGMPSLRTPEGWRELPPGEVVSLLPGEAGAHQLQPRRAGRLPKDVQRSRSGRLLGRRNRAGVTGAAVASISSSAR